MPIPEMYPVSSSNVAAVGYDAENQTVYVRFLDGSTYAYKGVPVHEFDNLRTASSVGSYLNRNYKNVYPYERA
jgi:KTSC domain